MHSIICFGASLITTEISKIKETPTLNDFWSTSLFPLKTSLLQKRFCLMIGNTLNNYVIGLLLSSTPFFLPWIHSKHNLCKATQVLWKVDKNLTFGTINYILIHQINTLTCAFIFRVTSPTSPLTRSPSPPCKTKKKASLEKNEMKVTKLLVWVTSRGTRNQWNIRNSFKFIGKTGNVQVNNALILLSATQSLLGRVCLHWGFVLETHTLS